MNNIEVGMLAKSLAGHDKNNIYYIHSVEGESVYLIDGSLRTLEKPKRKNSKHIQVIHNIEETANFIVENKANNEQIKKLVKEYKKEHKI